MTDPRAIALYGMPMSSSFVLHVACLEAKLPHELRWVDRATKKVVGGGTYEAIVPKGTVPALLLHDGSPLSETAAVLQWVADHSQGTHLAPTAGTEDRYRLVEWLNFLASEVHAKHMSPMFGRTVPEPVKARARELVRAPLGLLARTLDERTTLLGEAFSVADIYLAWMLFALPHGGVPLDAWPSLQAYLARHAARPAFQAALTIEVPLYRAEQARTAA